MYSSGHPAVLPTCTWQQDLTQYVDNGGDVRMVDNWTTYDRENRITLTQGELVDVKNAQGVVTGQQNHITARQGQLFRTTVCAPLRSSRSWRWGGLRLQFSCCGRLANPSGSRLLEQERAFYVVSSCSRQSANPEPEAPIESASARSSSPLHSKCRYSAHAASPTPVPTPART